MGGVYRASVGCANDDAIMYSFFVATACARADKVTCTS